MQPRALILVLVVVSSACAEPVITSKNQIAEQPGPAVVRCAFSRPLLDCRVHLSVFDELIDFGNGSLSGSVELTDLKGSPAATVSYEGDGLSAGHCGVSIAVVFRQLISHVECLGKIEDQGWIRGYAMVTANGPPFEASNSSTPRLVMATSGSEVAVLLKAQVELFGCGIMTASGYSAYWSLGKSLQPDGRYRQYGAGIEQGECGLRVANVTQRDAGLWWWVGLHKSEVFNETVAFQWTVVVVSAAPEAGPVLTVQDPASLRVDSQLTATCRAPPGAPPAKLTWLLDGQVVRQDDGNDVMPALHVWQPMEAVQTFKRRLSEDDVGKRLECRADHTAGSWSASDSWLIATPATTATKTLPAQSMPTQSTPTQSTPTQIAP